MVELGRLKFDFLEFLAPESGKRTKTEVPQFREFGVGVGVFGTGKIGRCRKSGWRGAGGTGKGRKGPITRGPNFFFEMSRIFGSGLVENCPKCTNIGVLRGWGDGKGVKKGRF